MAAVIRDSYYASKQAILAWLDYRWAQAVKLIEVIHETRFSFFVVLAVVIALVMNDQGREIAVRGGDSANDLWAYPLATAALALQVWFWARIILSINHPRVDGKPESALIDQFPRWLGIVCCAIPIVALAAARADGQAGARFGLLMGILIGTLALFIVFVLKRRELAKPLPKLGEGQWHTDSPWNPYNIIFMSLTGALALVFTAWAWSAPHSLGGALGAAPVLMLGLSCIVAAGSSMVLFVHGSKFPIVTAFIVTGLFLSSCDPHYIREREAISGDTRPTLAAEFATWKALAPAGDGRPTMVVVAASGGGITAAYWTSTVLTQLSQFDPRFTERLFSISSVSGGSVGTAAFTQALNCSATPRDDLRQRVEGALQGDLLAPTIGTALFEDVFFWFPPASLFAHYEVKTHDRAATFEEQLEHQWRAQFPAACAGLDDSFLAQRGHAKAGRPWRPIMLLNSAHQETGRPVILSQANLAVAGDAQPFESAIDYFAVAKRDLRISTAALNSARFPFVSPAGQVRYEDKPPALRIGHLIDGGYFENDGAFTTLRLLESLDEELRDIRVIVIQISIDSPEPYSPPRRTGDRSYLADRVAHQAHFANELLAPVYGFFATRDGHQAAARDALKRWATRRGDGAVYVHFRALIPRKAEGIEPVQPPLGWLLSNGSEKQLRERTLCLDRNHDEWGRLAPALGLNADRLARCGDSEPPHRDVDRGFPP